MDGIVLLHSLAFLVSTVALTISLMLFFLLKEQWRLYLALFLSAVTIFLLCDTLGIVLYCSVTGAVIYLLSLKRLRRDGGDGKLGGSERELVFFLLTTIVLLPLELLEYLYKLLRGSSTFFPIRLLVTPLFLLELGLFFTFTGFRTVRRLQLNRELPDIPFSLSGREKEVARLIAEGLTHKEIALKLFISWRTVDRHVENIYRKCGARNKADFIRSVIIPN